MATPYEKTAADTRSNGSPLPDHLAPLQDDGITPSGLPESSIDAASHEGSQSLADYVEELAQGIAQLADNLRTQNADQALHNAGKMAQDNPSLFLLGSLALGFGLSRVLKTDSAGAAASASSVPSSPSVGAYSPLPESSGHESAIPEKPFTHAPVTESPVTESALPDNHLADSPADFRDPAVKVRPTRDGSQGA